MSIPVLDYVLYLKPKKRMKMSEEFIQWILIPALLIPAGWITNKLVVRSKYDE